MTVEAPSRTKAHTVYRLKDGTMVPGVTTIVNLLGLNKRALIQWANRIGLDGYDANKYRDEKADIGTLTHYMVLCHLKGEEPDTSEFPRSQIIQAENAFLSYLEWEKAHRVEPILIESSQVSEAFEFGGTWDFLGYVDGRLTIMDFKTGKNLYRESEIQLGAYRQLAVENGYNPEQYILINIGRDETESFQQKVMTDLKREWEIFRHLLAIDRLIKQK